MGELGCSRIISGKRPDDFKTLDLIAQTCELFNQANAVALEHGLRFGIHNHWWEFLRVEGRPVYQVMLEHLEPEVFFEIDTYWAKTAGADPEQVLRELGSRAPILHIKDGPAKQGEPQVAVGEGVMDVAALVAAGGETTEWLIVELDHCATDMMVAVQRSYAYLVGEGLARGGTH
jgi:sugar phosphate isomerase/epimerase